MFRTVLGFALASILMIGSALAADAPKPVAEASKTIAAETGSKTAELVESLTCKVEEGATKASIEDAKKAAEDSGLTEIEATETPGGCYLIKGKNKEGVHVQAVKDPVSLNDVTVESKS